MTIFVDELFTAAKVKPAAERFGQQWCHMTTDGDMEELHQFAERLGLRRAYFQAHPTLPHYDLTPSKRAQAVRLGAKEITTVERLQQEREKRGLGRGPEQQEAPVVPTMKILSIMQPWTWAIAQSIKNIENRNWTTSYRGLVLLHAGKRGDDAYFDDEREYFDALAWESTLRQRGYTGDFPCTSSGYQRGGIVGIAELTHVVTRANAKSPWFRGPYGFVFKDARPLPFISLRGLPTLFDAPAEIAKQILQGEHYESEVSLRHDARRLGLESPR